MDRYGIHNVHCESPNNPRFPPKACLAPLLHEAFAIALRDALLLSPNDPTGWISGGFLVDLTVEI